MKKNNLMRDFLVSLSPEEQVLSFWNDTFQDVKGVTKHQSLETTCQLKNEITGEIYHTTIEQVIRNVLMTYKIDYLKEAISNYHAVITGTEYYYNMPWRLADFLNDGIFIKFFSSKDPFTKFRKSVLYKGGEDDPIKSLAKDFQPLTVSYDKENIYDKQNKTYFGFPINKLRKFQSYKSDVEYLLRHQHKVDIGTLHMIELTIAGLLFTRKKTPQAKEIIKFMDLWRDNRKVITKSCSD